MEEKVVQDVNNKSPSGQNDNIMSKASKRLDFFLSLSHTILTSPFPTIFSYLSEKNCTICATYANAFSFAKAKHLIFSKGLNLVGHSQNLCQSHHVYFPVKLLYKSIINSKTITYAYDSYQWNHYSDDMCDFVLFLLKMYIFQHIFDYRQVLLLCEYQFTPFFWRRGNVPARQCHQ